VSGKMKKEKSVLELKEEIKQLKKRVKDLERERDILLALHRRDMNHM
jgi:cell division protein FtsB